MQPKAHKPTGKGYKSLRKLMVDIASKETLKKFDRASMERKSWHASLASAAHALLDLDCPPGWDGVYCRDCLAWWREFFCLVWKGEKNTLHIHTPVDEVPKFVKRKNRQANRDINECPKGKART